MGVLSKVVEIMEEAGLHWLVDAGTLLGLMREGQILPWDDDVDIICWAAEGADWTSLEARLQRAGFRVSRHTYHGLTYLIRAVPPGYPTLPKVDIYAFRRHGGVAWAPARHIEPNRFERMSLRWFGAATARKLLWRMWRRTNVLTRGRRREAVLARLGFVFYTWTVPARYLDDRQSLEIGDGAMTVPAPAAAEEYLELRYGDWQTPDPRWHYLDDPLLSRSPPTVAVPGVQIP